MKQHLHSLAASAAHLGHVAWATTLTTLLCASLVLGGCKKAAPGGDTATLLSASVAKQLAPDTLAIVDALTDKTEVFGFFDLGQPLPALATSMGFDKALVDDVLALLESRAGLQLRTVQVVGMAKLSAKSPVFFFPGAAGKTGKSELGFTQKHNNADVQVIGEAFTTNIGTMLVVGEEAAIKGYLDERAAGGHSLSKHKPAWVKQALTLASESSAMITVDGDMMRREAKADGEQDAAGEAARRIIEQTASLTLAVAATGFRWELAAKPGAAAAIAGDITSMLALGQTGMQAEIAKLAEQGGEAAFGASLLRTYGTHFFESIEQSVAGDNVSLRLPFRAPPEFTLGAAPALAQHVAAPGEWMVTQLNLGAPALATMLKYTDVIGKPMDLAGVAKDIQAFMVAQLGVDFTQAQAATIAVAGEVPTFSIINAAGTTVDPGSLAVGQRKSFGDMIVAAVPWGAVIHGAKHADVMAPALAAGVPATSLTSHALLAPKADDPTIMLAAADLTLAPAELRAQMGDKVPVKAVYARMSMKGIDVEVHATPGKAPAIKALIGLGLGAAQDQARKLYEGRNSLPLDQALGGVVAHHQVQLLVKYLTPKDLGDDRLGFSIPMPSNTGAMRTQIGVAVVGILAAVAIPAFMQYMQRAKDTKALQPQIAAP
ncbi:MAG: hypothetical protein IPL79_15225 [Myxococcales bacterium]|nr:hypothetical protein [Myxococcales bacterium]